MAKLKILVRVIKNQEIFGFWCNKYSKTHKNKKKFLEDFLTFLFLSAKYVSDIKIF